MSFASRFLGVPPRGVYTSERLTAFIDSGVEESLNLDYKHIQAVKDPDKIAQTITAMANAEGGLVVLGVDEKKEIDSKGNTLRIRPGAITWGDASSLTRERLESLIATRIHPAIVGLRIHPIRGTEDRVVFLIDVPSSRRPPHQAPNRLYYLRYNFQNLPMDHYQIEALFFRRMRPDLRPLLEVVTVRKDGREADLKLGLTNVGGATAKQPLILCEFSGVLSIKEKGTQFFFSVDSSRADKKEFVVSSQSPINAIHPQMISYPGTIELTLDNRAFIAITVGAEDMPTSQFMSGVSADILRAHDFKAGPILIEVFPVGGETDSDSFNRFLRQLGIDLHEFVEELLRTAGVTDPKEIRKALEAFEGLARKGDRGPVTPTEPESGDASRP